MAKFRLWGGLLSLMAFFFWGIYSWSQEDTPVSPIELRSAPFVEGTPRQQTAPALEPGRTDLPANHPPTNSFGGPNRGVEMPSAPPGSASELTWSAPGDWVSQAPTSNMRVAQWSLSPDTEQPAVCVVFHFPGGGSARRNLERWAAQLSNSSVPEEESFNVGDLVVSTLWLTGTFSSRNPPMSGPIVELPDFALYGAVIESGDTPFFLKCTGPETLLSEQRSDMRAFLQSFRPR